MKIRPMVVELFHADGRTGRHDEANSPFSQFCEGALKTLSLLQIASPQPSNHFLLNHVCHTLLRFKPVLCMTFFYGAATQRGS